MGLTELFSLVCCICVYTSLFSMQSLIKVSLTCHGFIIFNTPSTSHIERYIENSSIYVACFFALEIHHIIFQVFWKMKGNSHRGRQHRCTPLVRGPMQTKTEQGSGNHRNSLDYNLRVFTRRIETFEFKICKCSSIAVTCRI